MVGVPFILGIVARSHVSAGKKLQRYMHTYYEILRPDVETEQKWIWHEIGVGVKLSEIVEVKDFEELCEVVPKNWTGS